MSKFEIDKNDLENLSPVPYNINVKLCEDSKGNICIETWSGGLIRFKQNNEIKQF